LLVIFLPVTQPLNPDVYRSLPKGQYHEEKNHG
jgi:hypothetical protein